MLLFVTAHPAAAFSTAVASDPPSVEFGTRPVGSSSSRELTLQVNPGLPVGSIARILSVEVGPSPFALVSTDCNVIRHVIVPSSLPTSCKIVVSFGPTEPGAFSGSVTIRYEADHPGGWVTATLSVPLSGSAIRCKPGYGHGDKNHCHSGPRSGPQPPPAG